MRTAYTWWLMSASALLMAFLGLIASFLPDEILLRIGAPSSAPLALLVQVTGALYLGFAMLNWMARANLIGGIYSRPLAVGNLLHFVVVTIAWTKLLATAPVASALWPLGLLYGVFAAGFAVVLFRHPLPAPAGPGAGA